MTRQSLWDPSFVELRKKQQANLQRLGQDIRGYTLVTPFNRGATADLRNARFEINRPNYLGNSWEPLDEPVSKKRWIAGPSEASQVVGKAASLYGVDEVSFCELDRRGVYSHYYDVEGKQSFPIVFSDEPEYEQYREPIQLDDGTQVIPKEMSNVVVLLFEMDYEVSVPHRH